MSLIHVVAIAVLGGASLLVGQAEGYIKVEKIRKDLRYAVAGHVPDRFDHSKQVLHLILSDAPVPVKAVFDGARLFAMSSDIQVVEFDFSENGVMWFFRVKRIPGSRSLNASPNPFPYEIAGDIMKGKIQSTSDDIDISVTYSARIEKPVAEPVPTAADAAAAQSNPAAKAYLKWLDAIQKGDKAGVLDPLPPDKRSNIESADFNQILPAIQHMVPKNVKVLKAVSEGDTTTLWVSGTEDGKPQKGEIEMHLENGRWIVRMELWHE